MASLPAQVVYAPPHSASVGTANALPLHTHHAHHAQSHPHHSLAHPHPHAHAHAPHLLHAYAPAPQQERLPSIRDLDFQFPSSAPPSAASATSLAPPPPQPPPSSSLSSAPPPQSASSSSPGGAGGHAPPTSASSASSLVITPARARAQQHHYQNHPVHYADSVQQPPPPSSSSSAGQSQNQNVPSSVRLRPAQGAWGMPPQPPPPGPGPPSASGTSSQSASASGSGVSSSSAMAAAGEYHRQAVRKPRSQSVLGPGPGPGTGGSGDGSGSGMAAVSPGGAARSPLQSTYAQSPAYAHAYPPHHSAGGGGGAPPQSPFAAFAPPLHPQHHPHPHSQHPHSQHTNHSQGQSHVAAATAYDYPAYAPHQASAGQSQSHQAHQAQQAHQTHQVQPHQQHHQSQYAPGGRAVSSGMYPPPQPQEVWHSQHGQPPQPPTPTSMGYAAHHAGEQHHGHPQAHHASAYQQPHQPHHAHSHPHAHAHQRPPPQSFVQVPAEAVRSVGPSGGSAMATGYGGGGPGYAPEASSHHTRAQHSIGQSVSVSPVNDSGAGGALQGDAGEVGGRVEFIPKIQEHCLALYNFASRFANQPSHAHSMQQPSQADLAHMARRAAEVVALLEDFRRLALEEEAGRAAAAADDVAPVSAFSVGAGGGGARAPKRPWEDVSADDEPPTPTRSPAGNRSAGVGGGSDAGGGGTAPIQGPEKAQTAAEKDMALIRRKRATHAGVLGSGAPKGKYRKRSRATPPGKCHSCNIRETPEWRRGPDGARTLCNACGLHYAKLLKKRDKASSADGGGVPIEIDMETLRASTRAATEREQIKAEREREREVQASEEAQVSVSTGHPHSQQQQQQALMSPYVNTYAPPPDSAGLSPEGLPRTTPLPPPPASASGTVSSGWGGERSYGGEQQSFVRGMHARATSS